MQAIEQLQGAAVPASALESLVLPARVPGYSPAMLDELTASGEVVWAGQGGLPGGDGWVSLYLADTAPLLMAEPAEITLTPLHEKVLEALGDGGAVFFRTLSDRVGSLNDQELVTALWDLVWAGRLTNDTLAPLRATLGSGPHDAPATRPPAPAGDAVPHGPADRRRALVAAAATASTTRPDAATRWPRRCSTATAW